ncbi:ScbA/BarX family gamma-butyrolactone biosynthesis protein [Streptomyces sp. NPDC007206]|uniref:ScbA/BarX family gamma-butyrolactone biosynthesis protein n=1 Tax=Streptomyces sp. NPDC007206 TaxID=3154317 RepID=UPI0033E950D5
MDVSAVVVAGDVHTRPGGYHQCVHGGTHAARACGGFRTSAPRDARCTLRSASAIRVAGRLIAERTHVPKELVHKAVAGEVLLGDAVQVAEDRFIVTVRWSRDRFLGHRGDRPAGDPLLLAEAVRQAAIYLSHRFHEVPRDHAFVLCDLEFALEAPLPPGGAQSAPVMLEIDCTRAGRGTRMAVEVYAGGVRIGRAGMRWAAMERRRYAALRRRTGGTTVRSNATLDAAVAGAAGHVPVGAGAGCAERDSVLKDAQGAAAGGRWQLRLDLGHPVLFDHACDHIPGMALLEAFRQAARAASADPTSDPESWEATSVSITFDAFGELDTPVWIDLAEGQPGDGALRLTAVQGERTLATVELTGARLPGGGA